MIALATRPLRAMRVLGAAAVLFGACGASKGPAGTALPPPAQSASAANPAPASTPIAIGGIKYTGRLTQGGWLRGMAPAGTRTVALGGTELALAEDGAFFAAFDRDAPSTITLASTGTDGFSLGIPLTITPRSWRIESVNVPLRPGAMPDAAFRERRAAELAQIGAARARGSSAKGWRQAMVWPAAGRISGEFGSQRIYHGEPGAYHGGTDIAAPAGAAIRAPADGVVVLAATGQAFTLEGHLLIVDHGMGLTSAFLHCSDLVVHEGDSVVQGQLLGHVGMTGRATGPHLHWALTWRGRRLDPRLFASTGN